MGAGTNVQDRLVALHDLDCPWRPGDLAQRKGRIERQDVYKRQVYNNLNKLCDVKLIRRVSLEDSPDRYDRIAKHDHLVCQKCGKLSDICFNDLTQTLSKQLGNDFLYYDLKVFYICPDCQKAQSAEGSLGSNAVQEQPKK